jgi:hypothetical protein
VDTETKLDSPLMLYRLPLDHETYACEHMLNLQTGVGARYRFPLDGRTADALLCLDCNQKLPMPFQIVRDEPTTF